MLKLLFVMCLALLLWPSDVRDTQDYKRGHIKGAIGIPPSEIESRLNEIHKDKEIVLYCEGTWDGGSCDANF